MKTLKNISKMLAVMSLLIAFSSCKKDKNDGPENGEAGTYAYQGKTNKITDADYRSGNGDGAWVYFMGDTYSDFIQIRFAGLADYAIPEGTLTFKGAGAYDPAKNFKGGFITSADNVNGDEINGGKVTISKDGDGYNFSFEVTTAKGTLKGNFSGKLKRI